MSMAVAHDSPMMDKDSVHHVVHAVRWFYQNQNEYALLLQMMDNFANGFMRLVEACPSEQELDPDDAAKDLLKKAEDYFCEERDRLVGGPSVKQLGRVPREMSPHEKRSMVLVLGHFAETLQELRWAIMIHDGRASPVAHRVHSGEELLRLLETKE